MKRKNKKRQDLFGFQAAAERAAERVHVHYPGGDIVLWTIGGKMYQCAILRSPCPFCERKVLVALPKPELDKQTDGTTHVCHPSLGGCNHGFEVTA